MQDRAADNSRATHSPIAPSIPPHSSKSAQSPKKPVPVWYRLDDFELSHSERALLKAMYKFTRGGIMFYASFKKVARRASLSPKTVKRLIKGYVDKRNGSRHRGLRERGILTEVAEAGDGKKAATYRMNEGALVPLPRMLEPVQQELPGIIPAPKIGVPQPPVSDETPVRLGDTVTPKQPASDGGHGVQSLGGHRDPVRLGDTVSTCLGDTVSPDLRFRSEDPRALNPSGFAKPKTGTAEQTVPRIDVIFSEADFDEFLKVADESEPKELDRWMSRRTGLTGDGPAVFTIRFSQAITDDHRKFVAACCEVGKFPEDDASEAPEEAHEQQRFLWVCGRTGITPERGHWLLRLDHFRFLWAVAEAPGFFDGLVEWCRTFDTNPATGEVAPSTNRNGDDDVYREDRVGAMN